MNIKTAIVTGGASGMGQISALNLARKGVQVAVVDVQEEALQKVAKKSKNIHPYQCDISKPQAVTQTFNRITKELGTIDRLIHAAAIMPTEELSKMPVATVTKIMDINYCGTVYVTAAILAPMLKRGSGQIVIFGSIAGYVLSPHLGAYSASKAAVNCYTEQLIRETKGSGVQILLVKPPATDTPLMKQSLNSSSPAAIKMGLDQKRFAKPEVIVACIERALEAGQSFVLPTFEAKWLTVLNRISTAATWNLTLIAVKLSNKYK